MALARNVPASFTVQLPDAVSPVSATVDGAAIGTAFGGNDLKNAGWGALAGGLVGAAVGVRGGQPNASDTMTPEVLILPLAFSFWNTARKRPGQIGR